MRTALKAVLAVAALSALLALAKSRAGRMVPEPPGAIGELGSLRGALSVYYGDSQGQFPPTLDALVPKYLPRIPQVRGLEGHAPTNAVVLASGLAFTDSGGWLYVSDPASPRFGEVRIDCTHARDGVRWSDR